MTKEQLHIYFIDHKNIFRSYLFGQKQIRETILEHSLGYFNLLHIRDFDKEMMTFSFVVNYIPHSKDAKVFIVFRRQTCKEKCKYNVKYKYMKKFEA